MFKVTKKDDNKQLCENLIEGVYFWKCLLLYKTALIN